MTRDQHGDRPVERDGVADDDAEEIVWTNAERQLLEATLDFYAAAEGVIDFAGRERPQLRQDAAGFDAVRQTMGVLEARVCEAHAAGVARERIAEIARIEEEMVGLILDRRDAAPGPAEG
jgi:hypothetical protein